MNSEIILAVSSIWSNDYMWQESLDWPDKRDITTTWTLNGFVVFSPSN